MLAPWDNLRCGGKTLPPPLTYVNDSYFFQGTFLMTQAVAKVMLDQGITNGSIVNLASIVGKVQYIYFLISAESNNEEV